MKRILRTSIVLPVEVFTFCSLHGEMIERDNPNNTWIMELRIPK